MSFRWEAIMLEVYRLSKVDTASEKLSQKVVKEKKTQGGRLVVNHVLITFLVTLNHSDWNEREITPVKFLVLLEFN